MRVLHVIGGDLEGGAARGALWLHRALLRNGIDSRLVFQFGDAQDEETFPIAQSKWRRIQVLLRREAEKSALSLFYPKRSAPLFTWGLFGSRIDSLPFYDDTDLVHLHWIGGGALSFKGLEKIKKPVIWTLRDMWGFTGGCHYSGDCKKYQEGCGSCPQLGSKRARDASRYGFNRKRNLISERIHPVAISSWLAECAKRSPIFENSEVSVIHNGVDIDTFKPIDKSLARSILNLPTDVPIVGFGAIAPGSDRRKGAHKFTEALGLFGDVRIHCAIFGASYDPALDVASHKSTFLGRLKDDASLVLAYSAMDVFVMPSLEEAFGKTIIEAMACGTPVVAFDATGPKDIIAHRESGYLARPYDAADLAAGIRWAILENSSSESLARTARSRAVRDFSSDMMSRRYIELYEDVLSRQVKSC